MLFKIEWVLIQLTQFQYRVFEGSYHPSNTGRGPRHQSDGKIFRSITCDLV